MRVQFIKSPTGAFNYGYCEGDIADINTAHAREMIDAGFAVKIQQPEVGIEQMKVEIMTAGREIPVNNKGVRELWATL